MKRKLYLIAIWILSTILTYAQNCSNPIKFTWEGGTTGNRAVWKVDDTSNTYTDIGGVDVQLNISDPFLKNTNTSNPSDFGDYTKTNSFYGRGNLAFQITSDKSNQPVCLEFSFSKPVFLDKFEVFDIDYIGSGINPFSTYHDSVSFFASNTMGTVSLKLTPLHHNPVFTINGQSVNADFIQGINGDVLHRDSIGAIQVSSDAAISYFRLCYANGSKDKDGLSDSQAIKIMPFDFCEATGTISGTVLEYLTNAPLANSLLTLCNEDGTPVKDNANNNITYMTGPDGYYEFIGLAFGIYKIVQSNPPGYISENDIDGINDEIIDAEINVMAPFSRGNDFFEKLASPLPVRFGGMKAYFLNDQNIKVEWTTLSEINNDYFEISISKDLKDFLPVGKVKGTGNSNQRTDYNFSFDKLFNGLCHVRLSQSDFDGKSTILGTEVISTGRSSTPQFNVFPNPVSEFVTISYANNSNESYIRYSITNATGNLVLNGNTLISDQSEFILDVRSLIPGMYHLRLDDGNYVKSMKIMIVR